MGTQSDLNKRIATFQEMFHRRVPEHKALCDELIAERRQEEMDSDISCGDK